MFKTLRISFTLKNTYRVNAILFALKRIPLLSKILPASLYRVRGLKIVAFILALFWEVVVLFGGKLLYLALFILSVQDFLTRAAETSNQVFLHILLFLSLVGALLNTGICDPSKDKYYALISLRMDAKQYTLINYFYDLAKTFIGFVVMLMLFGRTLSPGLCILVLLGFIELKLFMAGDFLKEYASQRMILTDKSSKKVWMLSALFLFLAYSLPFLGMRCRIGCL